MSFFFNKQAKERKSDPKPIQAKGASKEILNRLGCRVCPLDKVSNCTPKMPPDLDELPTDIYFLGDSPDDEDDKAGSPFGGSSGRILKGLLARNSNYCLDNVVRDFHDDASTKWVAMEACRSLVTKSIEKAQPKIVVGLGLLPLQWVLGTLDMEGLRGRVFAVQIGSWKCWFLPTYHPQFILDKAFDKKQPLRSKLGHCLKFDVERAVRLADSLPAPVIDTPQSARAGVQAFDGSTRTQLAQVLALISEARRAPEKAIDVEATGLKPWATNAKLLTVAVSFNSTNFSFAVDHPKAGWKPDEKARIKAEFKKLLTDDTKIIAHNAPFECLWMIFWLGRESIWHYNWECTMMQAHFLDERRGKRGGNDDQFQPNPYQALDFLIKQHFGLAYKALFKLDRKNMVKADLGETLLYNGADTKYTLRLYHSQSLELRERGLYAAYREAVGRQPTVALMQDKGICMDAKQTTSMQKKLGAEIEEIEKRIRGYHEVQAYIRDRKTINIASSQDVLLLLKKYIRAGAVVNSDGKESVDKGVLEKLNHPIGKDIEEFRNRSKLKSTYVDPYEPGKGEFIFPDGKIHPAFNTTFATTGRTSSSEPNQQNWSKRNDEWVRKQVVASKNHVLVAFDFGQLEACTAAMCTKDKVLVKALWEDYDIHQEWAGKAARLYPKAINGIENITDKAVMKKFRSIIKNKMVFPAMFGATNESVAGYLNMPIEPVNKLMDEFWATFYGLYNWQKKVMHDYYNHGYVASLTGRRRHYPLTKNEAVNYPIQNLGCAVVCRAMVTLSKMAADTNRWYLQPTMNVHDDLTFDVPDNPQILEEAIETVYRVMLTPGYDFVNVPLSVSCSMGSNWLEMEDIGKFWSHRDV
jgi:uracil-DNA glycosylase family 4